MNVGPAPLDYTPCTHNLCHRSRHGIRASLQPKKEKNVPRNLLDDLAHESGPLAQMALGSRAAWFDVASFGFLPGCLISWLVPTRSPAGSGLKGVLGDGGWRTYVTTVETDRKTGTFFRHGCRVSWISSSRS